VTRPALRSILLGTNDPRRLRDWYTAALAPEDPDGFTEVTPTLFARRFGATSLLIDGRADLADRCPDPGRVILNFHVDDIRAAEARLVALGAVWVREPEVTHWGIIGTVLDPDGNYVQIVAPTPDSPTCLQRKEDHG
jgi:predicted enzyme related to lactoylglutathione lyase